MAQAERARPSVCPRRRRRSALGLGGLVVSVVAASCGGGGSTHAAAGTATTTAGGPASSVPTLRVVVTADQSTTFGTILASGATLYTLKPSQIACKAECLKIWTPLLLPHGDTSATAGSGVDVSKLGALAAAGGRMQVTYAGHALYWFSGDTSPGQVNGNVTDEWGTWSDVMTSGSAATSSPASSAPAPSSTVAPSSHNSSGPASTAPASSPTSPPSSAPSTTSRSPATTRAPATTAPSPTPTTKAPTTTTTAPTTTTTYYYGP